MRAIWVLLPSTLLWGASFPLALAAVARRGQDPGRLVGGVYAANTVGAIIGALVTGLGPRRHGRQPGRAADADRGRRDVGGLVLVGWCTGGRRAEAGRFACGRPRSLVVAVPASSPWSSRAPCRRCPGLLVAYGRYAATWVGINQIVYVGEGDHGRRSPSRAPERRAELPQRRQGAGVERAAGHAAAAHARPHHDAGAREPGQGAGDRLRRRRDRRRGLDRPDGEGPDDRRDRAARAAGRVHALRRTQLQRRPQSEGQDSPRRRPALPADDRREVRRDHVGSAGPVGQGRGDALHARVLRRSSRNTSIPAASSRCSSSSTRAPTRR